MNAGPSHLFISSCQFLLSQAMDGPRLLICEWHRSVFHTSSREQLEHIRVETGTGGGTQTSSGSNPLSTIHEHNNAASTQQTSTANQLTCQVIECQLTSMHRKNKMK